MVEKKAEIFVSAFFVYVVVLLKEPKVVQWSDNWKSSP